MGEDQQTPLRTKPRSCSSSNELDGHFKRTDMDATTLPTPSSGSERQIREKKINWTVDMKRCFLNLLIEQVQVGHRIGSGFRTKAWNTMTAKINTLQNMDLRKENLQNKYKVWKKEYKIVKELRNQFGFGWNEERQMVVADDLVWNDYLQRHKVAGIAKFRWKPFLYYEELKAIVGDDSTEGHMAQAFGEIGSMGVNNGEEYHAHLGSNGNESSTPARTRPSESNTASEPRRKKKKTIHDTMDIIAQSMVKVGDALKRISMQQDSHIEPIYEALMAIPGMSHEDPVFIAAYEYYADERVKAMAFLRLPKEARASYIYRKFGAGSTV